jgi:hypothetical protein
LEDEEFALRSLQQSTINNRQAAINLPFAAGKAKPVAIYRAKIRPKRPLPHETFTHISVVSLAFTTFQNIFLRFHLNCARTARGGSMTSAFPCPPPKALAAICHETHP